GRGGSWEAQRGALSSYQALWALPGIAPQPPPPNLRVPLSNHRSVDSCHVGGIPAPWALPEPPWSFPLPGSGGVSGKASSKVNKSEEQTLEVLQLQVHMGPQ
uniref:Uncharacterized protein n=1 Tax=Sus scrofa TaxID=9823 RepID=A0A8D0Y5V1_PIG